MYIGFIGNKSILIFLGANPAIRSNLFVFKEKIKRISTSIGAKKEPLKILLLSSWNFHQN